MRTKLKFRGSLGLLGGLALALAGAAPRPAAAEPVKIGFAVSLSGPYTALGEDLRDGLQLYLEQIGNKAAGREIQVLVEDIGSNQVSKALEKARKLIQKDKVSLLAGVVDSGSAYALAGLLEQAKLPFVISNAGADDLTQEKAHPLIVRPSFVDSADSHVLGAWAYEKGYRKAVLLAADYAAGYEHVGGFARTFTAAGAQVVQEIYPPLGTQDYAPYLTQIKRDADVVMVFFAGADALRFVKQYAEYGLKGKLPLIGKGFLVDDNILPKQAEAAEGIITISHWSYLIDTPENKAFKTAFEKKYGRKATLYAEQGYVTGMLIAEGLQVTNGQVKGEEFVKAMRGRELNAPRGKVRFDRYGGTIQTMYLRKVEMVGGDYNNVIFQSFPSVNQFWNWSPEDYMKMPSYISMKSNWVK
ncbi:MAG: ABC transporter substrate-binding protein [Deferrisomatales bacterium]